MKLNPETRSQPKAPPGEAVFAVGDIHGRLDLLARATEEIASRIAASEAKQTTVVFLGDYIDRGPASRGVIDHLLAFEAAAPCRCVFLRGNHEQVLLDLLDGEEQSTRWLGFGGVETLSSYGVAELPRKAAEDHEALRTLVAEVVPETHQAFLRRTEFYLQLGSYLFVHAGLRPDRLLEEQALADFLWYRYYEEQAPLWSETVVHGHTVSSKPVRGRWRIGIDTGAYSSGNLTVLALQGAERALWRVHISPDTGQPALDLWDTSARKGGSAAASAVVEPREQRIESRKIRYEQRKSWPVAGAIVAAIAVSTLLGWMFLATSDAFSDTPTKDVIQAARQAPISRPRESAAAPVALVENSGPPGADVQGASASPPPEAPPPAYEPPHAIARPEPQSAPAGSARVQIGALPSSDEAEQAWENLAKALPVEMKSKRMAIVPVSVRGKTLYRSFVEGFDSLSDAKAFCGRLAASGRACLVRTA